MLFTMDLRETYPKALVILTVRDAEQWYTSYSKMVAEIRYHCNLEVWDKEVCRRKWSEVRRAGCGCFEHEELPTDEQKAECIDHYVKHNSHIQRSVPNASLLVFNVKEGWPPLCKFLGHEMPSKPFPHVKISRAIFTGMLLDKVGMLVRILFACKIVMILRKILPKCRQCLFMALMCYSLAGIVEPPANIMSNGQQYVFTDGRYSIEKA